ncbi:MAG: alpha/beta hydrolase [Paracoccaceae bacterium]|nr:alpha/beta hydrolase [Paracoccaceae bacterium]
MKLSAGISYIEAGQGPAIICLHGIGGGRDSFVNQLSGIPNHRVIAWDMPGYGESDEGAHNFAALSTKLSNFIKSLGLQQVVLVGQSIGGMLAIEHALRHKDQVVGLVLMATTPSFGGRDDSFKDTFLKARLAPLEAGKSMHEMAKEAAPHLVGAQDDHALIAEIARILGSVPMASWRSILPCLTTFNRRNDLGDIQCPSLVVCGAKDASAPVRTMEWMANHLAQSAFHVIDNAGHMVNQEAPKEVNNLITEFLKRNSL